MSVESVYAKQAELVAGRVPFALCTIIDRKGSSPAKPGAKMIVTAQGETFGTIGGAELEFGVVQDARRLIAEKSEPIVKEISLFYKKEGGVDLACGGTVQVFIEAVLPSSHVLIVGGGHVGHALAQILDVAGTAHAVCDARPEFRSAARFPNATAWLDSPAGDLSIYDAVVVMTHGQEADYTTLIKLSAAGYSGPVLLIGSKAKWTDFSRRLEKDGVPPAFMKQIRCPAGMPIHAATVGEIAVSFAAWLVDFFRGAQEKQAPPKT